MAKILIAMEDAVAVIEEASGQWQLHDVHFDNKAPRCLALDPFQPERIYCGTQDDGLWRSPDGGFSWQQVGKGITHKRVLAVACSPTEPNVVWAGTEPSALFRSEDGGSTWTERTSLKDIPSRSEWRMPVPLVGQFIHHVRWIQPDPLDENVLFVAVEMGGVMKSTDKGLTWQDHNPTAQVDAHSLTMHQRVPGRLYEAAGGGLPAMDMSFSLDWPPVKIKDKHVESGYAQSIDGGENWTSEAGGLGDRRYLWSIAVDADNPDVIIASVARGAIEGHVLGTTAESWLVRREGEGSWQTLTTGLPPSEGTIVSVVASHPTVAGLFYCANNRGIYQTTDAGKSWQRLPVEWPERYGKDHAQGIAIAE